MPYVQRDNSGKIVGRFANAQPGIADEWLADDAPDIVNDDLLKLSEKIRAARNTLLSKSDWAVLPDAPLTATQVDGWKAYRQALRDVPSQPGFPNVINWPVAP